MTCRQEKDQQAVGDADEQELKEWQKAEKGSVSESRKNPYLSIIKSLDFWWILEYKLVFLLLMFAISRSIMSLIDDISFAGANTHVVTRDDIYIYRQIPYLSSKISASTRRNEDSD